MANLEICKVACLLLTAAVLATPVLLTNAAAPSKISCGQVITTLAPCYQYVLGGGNVPDNCCAGVNSLYKEATTTADRRSICSCLKSITGSTTPAAVKNAKNLPGKCGLTIPYEITPAIDCNKVK